MEKQPIVMLLIKPIEYKAGSPDAEPAEPNYKSICRQLQQKNKQLGKAYQDLKAQFDDSIFSNSFPVFISSFYFQTVFQQPWRVAFSR